MRFDPLYLLMIAPAFLLSLFATFLTQSRFRHYAQIPTQRGMRGADVARWILDRAGLRNVVVEEHGGFLSDHYDPTARTVRLSPDVYNGTSVSSFAVAAHETGHALQHAENYWPMYVRSRLVPLASIGSNLGYLVMFAGLAMHAAGLTLAGVILFSAVVLFQVITLPVEFDASARAKNLLWNSGLVVGHEREGVSKVLSAAALTYVAAAVSSLLTLLYFLMRSGLLGGSRDER